MKIKLAPSSNGEDTTLSRWRYEFDSRWGYKIIKKKLDSYGVYVVYYSMDLKSIIRELVGIVIWVLLMPIMIPLSIYVWFTNLKNRQ